MEGSLETRISDVLRSTFAPAALEVANTTREHLGHREMAGSSRSETHFRISMRSSAFNGMVSANR